jgi:16S rRNA (cytidine1402-2'-O)-methyltransferase
LEAPHRIEALCAALASLGERPVTIGRELTKQFEEIATVPAQALPEWLVGQAHRMRGEFVVVVHPCAPAHGAKTDLRVLRLLLEELPVKTAVRLAADITGEPRNALYEAALQIKNEA